MRLNLITATLSVLLTFLFVFASNAQTNDNSSKNEKKNVQEKAIKPSNNKTCPAQGVVRVRVTFDKSGNAAKIELVVSGGCKSFDENAVEAAKQVKLPPKIENGKPVPVVKILEYTFDDK